MAYDITDYDELQIYVTDGWREWYIPKFRIFMTVDGDFCNLYWTDTEKGSSGLTRLLSLDYNDVTFGYITPSSAGEVVIQIESYIVSAFGGSTPDLTQVLTAGNDGGGLEIENIADPTLAQSAATKNYVDNEIASIPAEADASTSTKGITKLSVAPVSATNPIAVGDNDPRVVKRHYTLDITTGTSTHTGTLTDTIVYSFEIPANTIGLNDVIEVKWMARKTSAGANNHQFSCYLNTSNAIGGNLIFLNTQGTATTLYFETYIKWLNSTTNYVAKQGAITPWGTNNGNVPLETTKDTTAAIWVVLSVQLTNIADTVKTYLVEVIHHKNS